jgi:hypothetical protein
MTADLPARLESLALRPDGVTPWAAASAVRLGVDGHPARPCSVQTVRRVLDGLALEGRISREQRGRVRRYCLWPGEAAPAPAPTPMAEPGSVLVAIHRGDWVRLLEAQRTIAEILGKPAAGVEVMR